VSVSYVVCVCVCNVKVNDNGKRTPNLPQGNHIFRNVGSIIPDHPRNVRFVTSDEFFGDIERWKVHYWMVQALIEKHLKNKANVCSNSEPKGVCARTKRPKRYPAIPQL
jgi:hypothetical protein